MFYNQIQKRTIWNLPDMLYVQTASEHKCAVVLINFYILCVLGNRCMLSTR